MSFGPYRKGLFVWILDNDYKLLGMGWTNTSHGEGGEIVTFLLAVQKPVVDRLKPLLCKIILGVQVLILRYYRSASAAYFSAVAFRLKQ